MRLTTVAFVNSIRQADVLIGHVHSIAQLSRAISAIDQTLCRWRKECGGLKIDPAKRFKEIEQVNARLKRRLVDAELDEAVLCEAARPDF